MKYLKNNILIIGDTHIPFEHRDYLSFCKKIQKEYKCGTVIHIGDVVDNHYMSYHETDPDGMTAGEELDVSIRKLKKWGKAFKDLHICIGNHDALVLRKAKTYGITFRALKSFNEYLETPKTWKWDFDHEFYGIRFQHGTGKSGGNAGINFAKANRQSTVIGHIHSINDIQYSASYQDKIFGMMVGCGVDRKSYAYNYGRHFPNKPILGCGVIQNGKVPILRVMDI